MDATLCGASCGLSRAIASSTDLLSSLVATNTFPLQVAPNVVKYKKTGVQ